MYPDGAHLLWVVSTELLHGCVGRTCRSTLREGASLTGSTTASGLLTSVDVDVDVDFGPDLHLQSRALGLRWASTAFGDRIATSTA